MSDQQTHPSPRTQTTTNIDASAIPATTFPDGSSPAFNKNTVRQAILKQLAEQTSDQAVQDTPEIELQAQEPAAPERNAEVVASPEQALTELAQAGSPTSQTDQLRLGASDTGLQSTPSRTNEFLAQLGASLRRVPGVDVCIVLAEKALNYVVLILRPPREVPRGREGVAAETPSFDNQHRDYGAPSQEALGNTLHLLNDKLVSDSLEASKKLHASIIKASHELGEAALKEDEQDKRAELERRALDEHEARKAAEVVRAIDNLSGAPNGETQAIINKLSGPFALSIEQAISLARDAERREVEQHDLQTQLDRPTIEARIKSITVPLSFSDSSLAA